MGDATRSILLSGMWEKAMIRNVNKFTREIEYLSSVAVSNLFTTFNTETQSIVDVDRGWIENGNYYTFHNGSDSDTYLRKVDLRYVDVCETDLDDDLTEYGFKLLGQRYDGFRMLKRWAKG